MALDTSQVRAGLSGALYFGATTTTAPTTATSALAAGFRLFGYLTEDGVTESYSDDTEEVKGWPSGDIIRVLQTGTTATLAFDMAQTNKNALELFFKGSVVTDGGSGYKIDVAGGVSVRYSFVADIIDDSKHTRLYVPSAEVTERGEVVHTFTGITSYPTTITAYPVSGVLVTRFSDDVNWALS